MALEIREYRPGDERAILAALETMGAPRSLEGWRWAFETNPAGRRVFLALDGARVVGQFATVPHKVWIAGREALFAEVVDSFVLPGGTAASAHLHLARTIVRRAERLTAQLAGEQSVNRYALHYLNRLSDHLFVLSRYLNDGGAADVLWVPGANR